MLTDEPAVHKALLRMVIKLEENFTLAKICCRRHWSLSGQCSAITQGNDSVGICKALDFVCSTQGLQAAAWIHPSTEGRRQHLRTIAMGATNGWTLWISTKALCPKSTRTRSLICC